MATKPNSYLLTLGTSEGLRWVLRNSRMAFTTSSGPGRLHAGDELFLYASRACLGRPMGDRGLVIGQARLTSEVERLDRGLEIGTREFGSVCAIEFVTLAPFGKGADLAALVPRLDAFPDKQWWSARLRKSLLKLSTPDATLLAGQLSDHARRRQAAIQSYLG